jgi:hypothetical protein
MGYGCIEVPDHVFGATARDGWQPLYNEKDSFRETFVTLGFLAAVTKRIRLSSGPRSVRQASLGPWRCRQAAWPWCPTAPLARRDEARPRK